MTNRKELIDSDDKLSEMVAKDDYNQPQPIQTAKKSTKPELTEQGKVCQEFVEANKQTVSETLTKLLKDKQFILVGENHISECDPIRQEIAISLPKLIEGGLTHIALEANSENQWIVDSMDYSDPNIVKKLKDHKIAGVGWHEGNYDILVMAKRLGLKVILIDHDDGRPDSFRDNALWQNTRDSMMMKSVVSNIDGDSRVLVYIGSAHVHKKQVESYEDGNVKRLGARLVENYGNENVSSIRYNCIDSHFDGLFFGKSPKPKEISRGKNEVVILPDEGPVKGDVRVTAADYIITSI